MENKSHALAAGAFVVVMMALLISLAVWLTRDTTVKRVYELSSKEPVTGLQPQASVRFKGVNVGKVMAIGFDPQVAGNIVVQIAIDDRAPITTSTFAMLGFQGVTGLAFVQLDDSGESSVVLPGNEPPARIPMRPGLLSKLSNQGESILSELQETSRRVNQLLQPDHQQQLMGAINSLGQAAAGINTLSTATARALPDMARETSTTLKLMQETSVRVGDSADEARRSASAFRTVTERMNAKGGMLDQMTRGSDTLEATGQSLNSATLPRLNRAVDEAARTVRDVSRIMNTVTDNPQALILGNAPIPPGPGEPGFIATPVLP